MLRVSVDDCITLYLLVFTKCVHKVILLLNIVNLLIKKSSRFFFHAYVSLADPEGGYGGCTASLNFTK